MFQIILTTSEAQFNRLFFLNERPQPEAIALISSSFNALDNRAVSHHLGFQSCHSPGNTFREMNLSTTSWHPLCLTLNKYLGYTLTSFPMSSVCRESSRWPYAETVCVSEAHSWGRWISMCLSWQPLWVKDWYWESFFFFNLTGPIFFFN